MWYFKAGLALVDEGPSAMATSLFVRLEGVSFEMAGVVERSTDIPSHRKPIHDTYDHRPAVFCFLRTSIGALP